MNGRLPWSHNRRYTEKAFHLPAIRSYLGFYLFKDPNSEEVYSTFQGALPAAVGIRQDGCVEILPRVNINKYRVQLWGQALPPIEVINPSPDQYDWAASEPVVVFTPAITTLPGQQECISAAIAYTTEYEVLWQTYTPEVPFIGRVNVFVANEGNGKFPVEKVVNVWQGRAPLPSFGAVISFDEQYFQEHFVKTSTFGCLDQHVRIEPLEGTDWNGTPVDFERYTQILGGLVPLVMNGEHLCCEAVHSVEEAMQRLNEYGNAASPIARCGQESKNFDPYVREPAGVLVQTESRIGWILFDGRHELSLGANVIDVAQLVKKLDSDERIREKALGGEHIRHAVARRNPRWNHRDPIPRRPRSRRCAALGEELPDSHPESLLPTLPGRSRGCGAPPAATHREERRCRSAG